MTTKRAVLWLRRLRTRPAPPGSSSELAAEIGRVIDDYRLRHPMSWRGVRLALESLGDTEAIIQGEADREAT